MQHNQNQFVDQYLQFLTLTNLTCCVNVNWQLDASQFFDLNGLNLLFHSWSMIHHLHKVSKENKKSISLTALT